VTQVCSFKAIGIHSCAVFLVVFYVLQLLCNLSFIFLSPYENMMTELCNVQCYMFNCHKILGNVLRS